MAESRSNDHRPLSGYKEDFVEEVEEDFRCPICHLPLKEPVLTRCGHRYCKECLDQHIERNFFRRSLTRRRPFTCLVDSKNQYPNKDIFPDKATERKILSLAIRCPSDGCGWNGELRNKEAHLGSCPFHQVACTNKNCGKIVQRRHLKQHESNECLWRILQCTHCFEPHPECQMEDHITKCSLFPLTCPNHCGCTIPRKEVSTHIEDKCRLTWISCPYALMGCKEKVQRQEVESHLESAARVHLDLACVKLNNTEDELNKAKDKLTKIEDKLDNTVALLNETRVAFEKSVELLQLASVRHEKMFLWRIDSFSEILKEAKNGGKDRIGSDPFYIRTETESFGYKLRISIDPNGSGDGKGTHLSAFIIVMKGTYDAILPWPINGKVKFTLIDQQEDPNQRENYTFEFFEQNLPSFARPLNDENQGYGWPKFISHEKLNSRRFIVDDTLFFKVEISSQSSQFRTAASKVKYQL